MSSSSVTKKRQRKKATPVVTQATLDFSLFDLDWAKLNQQLAHRQAIKRQSTDIAKGLLRHLKRITNGCEPHGDTLRDLRLLLSTSTCITEVSTRLDNEFTPSTLLVALLQLIDIDNV